VVVGSSLVKVSVEFRADDQPVTARADYWHHVVAESLTPLDLTTRPTSLDSRDRLRVGGLGPVSVAQLSTGATSHAVRRRSHIRSSDPDLFKIDVQTHGVGVIDQFGRQERYRRGDFTLVDLSRPCAWANEPHAGLVAITFPRHLLPLSDADLSEASGVRVSGDQGTGALVSSLARQLPGRLDELDAGEAARLGTSLLDLLAVALLARLGRVREAPASARRQALVASVHAYIGRHLSDPGLSPARVADAHHISLRYLHRLFAADGTSVSRWVKERRLEGGRRDLADPSLIRFSVAAIAARWGILDAAAFSRSFRMAFGLSPREYRMRALGTRPQAAGPAR
jgi:AraC-like DNA-binding protein